VQEGVNWGAPAVLLPEGVAHVKRKWGCWWSLGLHGHQQAADACCCREALQIVVEYEHCNRRQLCAGYRIIACSASRFSQLHQSVEPTF